MGKKKIICVLDTETAGGLSFPLPYDFSFAAVRGSECEIIESHQLIIREIFLNTELMDNAYYAEKVPDYWKRIWSGEAKLVSQFEARQIFINFLNRHKIVNIYAYNVAFDRRALNNLIKYCSENKYRFFFPKAQKFNCIWNMACETFLATRKYYDTAKENGWFSSKGNLLTNAEVAYNYIIGTSDFKEEHKGIDDVKIETEILKYCLTLHKKIDRSISYGCWRKAQKVAKKERAKKTGDA